MVVSAGATSSTTRKAVSASRHAFICLSYCFQASRSTRSATAKISNKNVRGHSSPLVPLLIIFSDSWSSNIYRDPKKVLQKESKFAYSNSVAILFIYYSLYQTYSFLLVILVYQAGCKGKCSLCGCTSRLTRTIRAKSLEPKIEILRTVDDPILPHRRGQAKR
jgi:hypothetical protein